MNSSRSASISESAYLVLPPPNKLRTKYKTATSTSTIAKNTPIVSGRIIVYNTIPIIPYKALIIITNNFTL